MKFQKYNRLQYRNFMFQVNNKTQQKMNNQRLLYSQKKQRPGSINKQNNIKLFNIPSFNVPSSGPLKTSTQLKYDYENNTRIVNKKNILTSSQNYQSLRQLSPANRTNKHTLLRDSPMEVNISSTFNTSSNLHNNPYSLNQIQSYTNKLLQNNKLYQQQIFQLKQQNNKIKSQLEKSIAQNIKLCMNSQKIQQEQKNKFDLQIANLVKQLKQILKAKQQMESQYNKLIQEINQEHSREIIGRQQNFIKAQQFLKQKLFNLTNHLNANKQEKQKQYFQASDNRLKLMKDIDQLNYSLQKQRTQKRQLSKSNEQMIKIIKTLQKQLKDYKENLQQSSIQVYKIEKQKNQIIIELKSQNKQLCEGITDLESKIKDLDLSLSQKQIQFNRLENQLNQMKKQLDQKSKKLIQRNMEHDQIKNQIKKLQLINQKYSQSFTYQKKCFENLIQQLQTRQKKASTLLAQTQAKLNKQTKRSQQLSLQLQQSQTLNKQLNSEIQKLSQLNKKYKNDNIQLLEELQLLHLEHKSFKEQNNLLKNHCGTLEKQNQQLQLVLNKVKSKEGAGSLQMELNFNQIERLKQELNITKKENNQLNKEIDALVQQYEIKLKNKQEQWRKRVQKIQEDVQILLKQSHSPYPTSNRKQNNLWSKNSKKYEQQIISSKRQQKQKRSPYLIKNNFTITQQEMQNSSYKKRNLLSQKDDYNSYEQKNMSKGKRYQDVYQSKRNQSGQFYESSLNNKRYY